VYPEAEFELYLRIWTKTKGLDLVLDSLSFPGRKVVSAYGDDESLTYCTCERTTANVESAIRELVGRILGEANGKAWLKVSETWIVVRIYCFSLVNMSDVLLGLLSDNNIRLSLENFG